VERVAALIRRSKVSENCSYPMGLRTNALPWAWVSVTTVEVAGDAAALQNFREHLRQRKMTAQEALAGLKSAHAFCPKGNWSPQAQAAAHP